MGGVALDSVTVVFKLLADDAQGGRLARASGSLKAENAVLGREDIDGGGVLLAAEVGELIVLDQVTCHDGRVLSLGAQDEFNVVPARSPA